VTKLEAERWMAGRYRAYALEVQNHPPPPTPPHALCAMRGEGSRPRFRTDKSATVAKILAIPIRSKP
jgi:hypothetical protein